MQLYKDKKSFLLLKNYFCVTSIGTNGHIVVSLTCTAYHYSAFMTFIFLFTFILFIVYAGLLVYYRFAWKQIPVFQPATRNPQPATFVTVIIPARNEAANLPALLQSFKAQTYPSNLVEVIVIDDHSTDNTVAVAQQYFPNSVFSLKDFIPEGAINSYKKKAIEIGIQHSKGQLIITTDADCTAGPGWLQTIAGFYEAHQPELMVMPVAINCGNKAIEIFQALDFMTLQGITGAGVHKKMHSMCNGANLAYTRKAFDAVDGFKGIDNIASGDDMLLMHKIALQFPDGIAYLKSPEVIVQTEPVHSVKAFFNQRIRWASKADKYDDKRIFWVLLLVYFFNVLLLVLPVIGIFSHRECSMVNGQWAIWEVWFLLLLLKTLVELIFLYPVATFFGRQRLLWLFPLAQPFHIIYTVIAGWLGKFGSYEWKERKVK
jgi:cellulose synthase/poly-beta-1,6-N-acetylglucosamine synthase-like glycosyltransferase